jgi:hypothetical protein
MKRALSIYFLLILGTFFLIDDNSTPWYLTGHHTIHDYWYVTAAGAGAKTGDSITTAFGAAEFKTFMEGTVVAGDVIFILQGFTMTATINSSARDASAVDPIAIIGLKAGTTQLDTAIKYTHWATDSADRPEINNAAYAFTTGDYYKIRGINFAGTANHMVSCGQNNVISYIDVEHTEGSGVNEDIFSCGTNDIIEKSTFRALNCKGIVPANGVKFEFCTFGPFPHATYGHAVENGGNPGFYNRCIFRQSTIGIFSTADLNTALRSCTFYDCDTAIRATTDYGWSGVNIMIDSCGAGLVWTTQTDNNYWENILIHQTTTPYINVDTSTVYKDHRYRTGDPKLVSPSTGNFRIGSGSDALNTGLE